MTAQNVDAPAMREAIAPPERRGVARDGVRMLVTNRDKGIHEHARFSDLPRFTQPGDLFVVNDSATLPAAVRAIRENGEMLWLHVATMVDSRLWMAEPRGTVHLGEELTLPSGGSAVVIAPVDSQHPRLWYTWFQLPLPMNAYLAKAGQPIRYGYMHERFPLADYQTVFARVPGSSEMPSAARPFTAAVVREMRRAGVQFAPITLHCGVSSFEQPERPAPERFAISPETAEAVNLARRDGRRVVAVGTTVVRALESAVRDDAVVAASGWTELVIDPGHHLRAVDALLSGFHEPGSTHVSILRAFMNEELLENAYEEAAEHEYYYHEFGDIHAIF